MNFVDFMHGGMEQLAIPPRKGVISFDPRHSLQRMIKHIWFYLLRAGGIWLEGGMDDQHDLQLMCSCMRHVRYTGARSRIEV